MKKLILCLFLASTFITQANEKLNTENVSINVVDDSCTVTVTYTDSYGDILTGSGTASTCSEAKKLAYADLSKKVVSAG